MSPNVVAVLAVIVPVILAIGGAWLSQMRAFGRVEGKLDAHLESCKPEGHK